MAGSAHKLKPEGHNRNWAPPLRELHNSPTVQTKLEIGKPGDKYEQEADKMADKVMMAPYDRSKMVMMAPNPDNPTLRMMPMPRKNMVMMAGNPMMPQVQRNEMIGNEEEQEKVQMQTLQGSDKVQLMDQEEEEPMVQMMENEEEDPMVQMMENEEEDPMVQMMEHEEELVQTKPAIQKAGDGKTHASPNLSNQLNNTKGNGQPLPKNIRAHMEQGIGADFSDVKIHTDTEAVQMSREMGAKAFTHGSDVYFNRGQYDPNSSGGKRLLAHELTHTIQQGKSPKVQTKKEGPGSETLRSDNKLQMSSMNGEMIQRAPVDSLFGQFKDTNYRKVANGVTIKLEFDPGENVDAKKIGLMQSVKPYTGGNPSPVSPTQVERTVTAGAGKDYYHDRTARRNNPIYGGRSLVVGETLKDTPLTNASSYQLGYHYTDKTGLQEQNAWLSDTPTRPGSGNDSGQIFETTALAVEGTQKGTYYGSVQWGWTRSTTGTFTVLPLSLVSKGVPSQKFMAPAAKWNSAKARGTYKANVAPTQIYDAAYSTSFTVTKGTTMTLAGGVYTHNDTPYNQATITTGPHRGSTGRVKVLDVKDQGDGAATVDIPLVTHTTNQANRDEAQLKAEIKTLKATLKGLAAGHVNIPQITAEIKVYEDTLADIIYNKGRGYVNSDRKAIQALVGTRPSGIYDLNTITKIRNWQEKQGLVGDGRFGPKSKKKFDAIVKAAVTANKAKGFTSDQIKKIQLIVGSNNDGTWGPITVKHLMVWQKNRWVLGSSGVFSKVTEIWMFGLRGF